MSLTLDQRAVKAAETVETALGNPTGDMSAVAQGDAASLAAYLVQLKEHYRAHDQTRICLIVPDLANLASDAQNTAIKAELDKIATVSVLDQLGVDDGQEDWAVYNLVVVGSNIYATPFDTGNLDALITLKVPIMVCNDVVAAHLEMGTAGVAQSTSDTTEYCESIHNRVMYLVFGSTGDKEIFDSAQVSDRLDMSDANLATALLMVNANLDTSAFTVVGWLPMETATGIINKLEDGTDIPAGRLFAGCFLHADHLTELGQLLLRRIARNFTQASITPSITLRAQAALVAAIANDTADMQPRVVDIETETANIILDTQIRSITSAGKAITFGAGNAKWLNIDSDTNGAEILAIILNNYVGKDWTVDTYVPYVDAVAGPAAGDKRDTFSIINTDAEGGLLKPTAIAFNMFLDFTNDAGAGDETMTVTVVYRSRAAISLQWEV